MDLIQHAISFEADSNKKWFPMLPALEFEQNGNKINITPDMLDSMVKNFDSGILGEKLPVTIGHPKNMASAPSNGKIKGVKIADYTGTDGVTAPTLFGRIDFNSKTAKSIDDEEYMYISAVFAKDKWKDQGGKERGPAIFAAGLTNTPQWKTQRSLNSFVAGMSQLTLPELANKEPDNMDKLEKQLEAAKGQIEQFTADLTSKDSEIEQLKKDLAEKETKIVEFTAEVESKKTEADKLADRVAGLEKSIHDGKVKSAVDQAIADGRITSAQEVEFTELANLDLERFTAIVNTMEKKDLPTKPKGKGQGDPEVVATPEEKARKFANDYCDENNVNTFGQIYERVLTQFTDGKAEDQITL